VDNSSKPQPTEAEIKASRRRLLLLFAMPVIAVALATFVYTTGIGIPEGTTNKGTLITPPVNVDESPLQTLAGAKWNYPEENDWTLINFAPAACNDLCRERIFLTRQIRTAQGREAGRLSRLLITPAASQIDSDFEQYLELEHGGMQRAVAAESELIAWLGVPAITERLFDQNLIMLADKNGFVMMYYTSQQPGKDLMADLKFLLKYSREKQPE